MPRLVGKQSKVGLYSAIIAVIALASVLGLEYSGITNLIPGLGPSKLIIQQRTR